jgi:nitric oxide reductase NorD protein
MAHLDLEPWEPEETVGKLWHAFASRLAAPAIHDEAAVELASVTGRLSVLFRGLGGNAAVAIGPAAREASTHRRAWRQRLGTTHDRLERPSFDGEALRLPARIAAFPEREDNAALYFWLAAAAAHAAPHAPVPEAHRDPLAADVLALRAARAMTSATLDDCPGLRLIWQRLALLCLATRPVHSRPRWEAAVEAVIRRLLGDPAPLGRDAAAILACTENDADLVLTAPAGYRPPAMPPVWPQLVRAVGGTAASTADEPDAAGATPQEGQGDRLKARRKEADQAERRDSLILHKFEAIFSWAEFLNINRKVEDDDEEGARKAAEDADEIGLGQVSKRPATRLKLHLDLAPSDVDRERLSGTHLYPEWDQRRGAYLADHARVLAAPAEPADEPPAFAIDRQAQRRIRTVRRQFEALRPARLVVPRQIDGDEIDLDAAVRARVDLAARGEGSDRLWLAARPAQRSLAVSILLDASRSTESACGEGAVIDVEKEALTALAWGLDACGDETAIRSFSSLRRTRVYVNQVKGFDEPMGPVVAARIAGLRPGFYTRLGAAVRHVSAELARRPRQRRLLLVVSDGKPNDLDHYEGRHGIEDSRMAVREARRMGNAVHGVIVARRGETWFPRIFGRGGFSVVTHPERLTAALPDIYRHLVGA